jgi:transposase
MGRKAKGREISESAKAYLSKAKTAEALRQAQAVVFPLEYGMTLERTAEAIGVSPGWACQLRNRFMKEGSLSEAGKPQRGGRRRENMSIQEERAFLLPFFERAKTGGFLVVNDIKEAMDIRLGRHAALASAYNLLHRHGWRKLAPDKRHPESDVNIQEAWKKRSSPN